MELTIPNLGELSVTFRSGFLGAGAAQAWLLMLLMALVGICVSVGGAAEESSRQGSRSMSQASPQLHIIPAVPKLVWGGLDTYTDDLMISSALRVCLDFIGEKHEKWFLAGASGAAFDLGWAAGTMDAGAGGAVFAHPSHFEPGIENLFRAIGRNYTVVYGKSDPERLRRVACESIDAGRPVIASEWRVDHFAVLAGYDAASGEFVGRRYGSRKEVPEDYVSIKPDTLAFVIAIGESTSRASAREAAVGALRFAIASARTGTRNTARGQGGTSHAMVYGPEAFTEHARLVPDSLDPNGPDFDWREHVLRWRLDALQLARAYAIIYLQEVEREFSPSAREHLRVAKGKYYELLGLLALDNQTYSAETAFTPLTRLGASEVPMGSPQVRLFGSADNFWSEDGKHISIRELLEASEGRQKFAHWLLKLRDIEEQAVQALENALADEAAAVQVR